jgi:hypothetical protein
MSDATKAWDRQPGESASAYAAFREYQWQERRSVRDVARQLNKSVTLIGRWSTRWNWVARVAAFDADQDRKRTAALEDERLTAARRQAQLGYAVQEVAVQALAAADPATLTVSEATRLLGLGVRIERDALDVTTTPGAVASGNSEATRQMEAAFAELEAAVLAD